MLIIKKASIDLGIHLGYYLPSPPVAAATTSELDLHEAMAKDIPLGAGYELPVLRVEADI